MRGQIVIVRAFGDKPLVRRVWDADDEAVYISGEAEFQRRSEGKDAPPPVPFPRHDVYEYDPSVNPDADHFRWERLERWSKSA